MASSKPAFNHPVWSATFGAVVSQHYMDVWKRTGSPGCILEHLEGVVEEAIAVADATLEEFEKQVRPNS